eukprot:m.182030 g.182030  ORF g.182030 m.182030 type:complete len:88 (+) comp39284_c0_seq2:670-933(+)
MSREWKEFASQIGFGTEDMETFKQLKKEGNKLAHIHVDREKMRRVFAKIDDREDDSEDDGLPGKKILRFLDLLAAAIQLKKENVTAQ